MRHETLPYWLALALSAGSLAVYFTGAIISGMTLTSEGKTRRAFNLGLPFFQSPEELFAISLVSASTTLSTIFITFLILSPQYGIHLLICPISFAGGTVLAIRIYRKLLRHGYMDDSHGSGLLPRFAHAFTESSAVTLLITLASVLPLLAVLILELRYGVKLFDGLFHQAKGEVHSSAPNLHLVVASWGFLIMLLGYVFIGGFRAVVTSDVWQYRTMKVGFGVASLALLFVAFQKQLSWGALIHLPESPPPPPPGLPPFT